MIRVFLERHMAAAQFVFDAVCFIIVVGGALEIVRIYSMPWPVMP